MLTVRFAITALLCASTTFLACASTADDADGTASDLSSNSTRTIALEEDVSVLVEHPETLQALEAKGFDLGSKLTGSGLSNNVTFAASAEGSAIIAAVQGDVTVGKQRNPGFPTFNPSWLKSKEASFQLVAVTNRLDRRHATPDACGEVHLVYRLAYTNARAQSRLPMTLMLVYPQPKEGADCASVANRWLQAAGGSSPAARAAALASGPLANLKIAPKAELNFQLVRWPTSARNDMGGHAEYSLRVFDRTSGKLAPTAMENSLRDDLSSDDKSALTDWIKSNVADIDKGTAKVPANFLATRVSSVSPRELSRAANRPFALLFGKDGAALPDVDLGGLSLVKSKAALVRRLDTMTCNGCHQSQGVAGFHALGTDRQETTDLNALADGISRHLREQVAFRKKDLTAVAGGSKDLAPIPFAEHGSAAGGYGALCGLGDPGFADWTCAGDLLCSDANGDNVGICVSKQRRAGEACEEATVSFTADPRKDTVKLNKSFACVKPNGAGGACVSGGFPTGMCTGTCTQLGKVEGDAICGVSVPDGFNDCLAAGKPFQQCLEGGTIHYHKACSTKASCGPDYVCAAVKDAPPGMGACMPPYFMFQVRVDGHQVGN
jgi:hypothetical protein